MAAAWKAEAESLSKDLIPSVKQLIEDIERSEKEINSEPCSEREPQMGDNRAVLRNTYGGPKLH